MEPLRDLENLVAQVDFRPGSNASKQHHRDIYSETAYHVPFIPLSFLQDYIEQVVLSPKSPIVKHVPSLPVIIYSIKNILYPNLVPRRIPDLLDLLATAEFYRGRTLDQARAATDWNAYYHTIPNEKSILLTTEDKLFLQSLESQKDALRGMYITILTRCCHLVSTP